MDPVASQQVEQAGFWLLAQSISVQTFPVPLALQFTLASTNVSGPVTRSSIATQTLSVPIAQTMNKYVYATNSEQAR